MNVAIQEFGQYTERMNAALDDKLFFLDKVDADVYFDFGCADGALLRRLKELCPGKTYIGFDTNPEMILNAMAIESVIQYRTEISAATELLNQTKGTKALILSSVIHEIYAYANPTEFWDWVWQMQFDYIVIRDMSVSRETASNITDFDDVRKVIEKSEHDHLHQFQMKYGHLDWEKNLAHWLLKYHYIDGWDKEVKYQRKDNWERELNENYFGLYYEDLLKLIPQGYIIAQNEHFTLPYIKDKVKRDLDIDFQTKTHVKLILRKMDV